MYGARSDLLEMLARTLDGLDESLMLVEPTGRVLYENPAMRRTLADDPTAVELRSMIDVVVSRMAEAAGPVRQDVVVQCGHVRLRARWLGRSPVTEEGFTLVCLQGTPPTICPMETLRRQFLLTVREAQVAVLLGRRRSNAEIAYELGVSPHTARHHTENILSKLGVRSRNQVASLLDGLSAAGRNRDGGA